MYVTDEKLKLKMSIFLLWYLIIILRQTLCERIRLQEEEDTQAISKCITRVIEMLGNLKIAMWYSSINENLVLEIMRKTNVPVVLNAVEHPKFRGLETRIHNDLIIILKDSDISQILNNTLWNGLTRFFICCQNLADLPKKFGAFWKNKVINVFGMSLVEEDIAIYSFLPYERGDCGVGKPFIVDKYISHLDSFMYNGKEFKDIMRIKNLNQCRVNITVVDVKPNVIFVDECNCNATTHADGIEAKVMNEVAKKLNFNATFMIALDGIGWGWIRPSPHGVVGEVFTGRSDFGIGLLAPTIERYENLDLSLPYNGKECITYGVPSGAKISTPNWITILVFEFSGTIWILIIFSFIFIYAVFSFVKKASIGGFPVKVDLMLYIFSSFLGLPIKTPQHASLRFSLLLWLLFSFIVTLAYRSSMGSKLTVPSRDPDINFFQELLDSKLNLTGYNNMLRLMQYNDSEPYIREMVNRFKVTDFDIDYAVDRIATERKIAYVRHTTTFLYYALINPKARGHIHVIEDCIYVYYPLLVTKKHSPFSFRLNQLISRLVESGITKKWRSEYVYSIPPLTKPFNKLSNDHMYGVFCILCFGYFIGFVTLLIENFHFNLKKRKKSYIIKNN